MTQSNQRIEEQAASWAIRVAGGLSAQDESELEQWLASDARHRGALAYAQAVWQDMDRVNALAGGANGSESRLLSPRDDGSGSGAAIQSGGVASRHGSRQGRTERIPAKRWLVAAALALFCCGLLLYGLQSQYFAGERYETPIGGTASVPLQDGSQVTLNTSSRVRVTMTLEERRIELQQGEAFFDVAKEKSRPFVVRAGALRVVAIGTQFSVRRDDDGLQVVVTEGRVRLEGDVENARDQIVEAGQAARITSRSHLVLAQLPAGAAQRRLAWRDGKVEFDGESLREAVAEMNRHNRRKIAVDDPVLAARPVIGIFPANDPEGFATTVAAALQALEIEKADAIHLSVHAQ